MLGGLLALVLIATPPWHGIAFARFGDSPVYETLRREATRVLYLPVWPGDSAHSGLYLYAVTRTRIPMVNGYSPLVPRRYVDTVFEPLEAMNVGDLGPARPRRSAGWTSPTSSSTAPVSRPRSRPTRPRSRSSASRASGVLALQQVAGPLALFRVTDGAPASNRQTSPVGVFYEAERQNHETGAVVDAPEASGGRVVAGRPGARGRGSSRSGPIARFRPAPTSRAFASAATGFASTSRATSANGSSPSARWIPARTGSTRSCRSVVEHARPLEFRVAWDGRREAAVDWVLVVAADRPEVERTYEVEALPHRLGERADPAASGGWAAYADPVESLRGDLLGGPARLFPAGRYQLALRLRAAGAGRGPLVRLSVTEPAGRTLVARVVEAAEAPPGDYREVTLDFTLDRPRVLEFPVAFLGDVGVFFDRVTVTPR